MSDVAMVFSFGPLVPTGTKEKTAMLLDRCAVDFHVIRGTLILCIEKGEFCMPNLTLAIEKEMLKKARKIAVEKDTSVTQMVRTYIEQMVAKEEQGIETVITERQRCFHAPDVVIGPISWRREDLHERWRIHFWDALILSAAERARCAVVLSEDLSDGQAYGRVTVRNPFVEGG